VEVIDVTRRHARLTAATVIGMVAAGMLVGASARAEAICPTPLPQGGDPVTLDAAAFVGAIDNPYLPLPAGGRWVYRETDGQGGRSTVRVTVLPWTRVVQGVTATVVRDIVAEHGDPIEKTHDFYAQDVCGSVWYLGERTREFEDGHVVSTAGSWEAGIDGASAGVIMPADPQVGMAYREEFLAGEAEDRAEVLAVDERVQVPAGSFRHGVLTRNTTPLEPRVLEYKLYAPGVGLVLAIGISGSADREELLRAVVPA
jgi:hypothetical protein